MKHESAYLGDGAYVNFDGYQFDIWCERENGKNWVGLEPSVLDSFLMFVGKQWGGKFEFIPNGAEECST